MQDERTGLRFAALMFVGVAAFLAVMTLVAYWQTTQIVQIMLQSDAALPDGLLLRVMPLMLGGGTFVVLAIAIGFWRAAANAASAQPYASASSYQTPRPSASSQPILQPSFGGVLDPNTLMAIKEQLAQDRVIQAVKMYREATGVGLKEARDAVLLIRAQM